MLKNDETKNKKQKSRENQESKVTDAYLESRTIENRRNEREK